MIFEKYNKYNKEITALKEGGIKHVSEYKSGDIQYGYVQPRNTPYGLIYQNTVPIQTTKGQNIGWSNPHGISIPVITFENDCKKCHGTGCKKGTFSSFVSPCVQCYSRHGYCNKCFGTGINYKKNKACLCKEGCKYREGEMIKKSQSSESSEEERK